MGGSPIVLGQKVIVGKVEAIFISRSPPFAETMIQLVDRAQN